VFADCPRRTEAGVANVDDPGAMRTNDKKMSFVSRGEGLFALGRPALARIPILPEATLLGALSAQNGPRKSTIARTLAAFEVAKSERISLGAWASELG
jgi:hypothetical protein